MPRIIDHEAYRAELARRAIPVFRRLGYHGLGMRQIASELGVSKSALYHYFPSKKALFEACSRQVTQAPGPMPSPGASPQERWQALLGLAQALDENFRGELSLLLDYTRGMSPEQLAADELMQQSQRAFAESVAALVGPERAQEALQQLMGILLQRAFGAPTPLEGLRRFVEPA